MEKEIRRYSEDLGFTLIHKPQIEYLDYAVLENENKRRIDLVHSYFPADSFGRFPGHACKCRQF